MNATEVQTAHAPAHEWSWSITRIAGSSITEAIGALGAIVLAIIGLAGLLPGMMASVATIVLGAALLMEGTAMGMVHRQLSAGVESSSQFSHGLTTEFFGGVAGIVLGILSFFGSSQTLLAVALIVFGATLLLGCVEFSQRQWFASLQSSEEGKQSLAFGSGGQLLMGMGAAVLGILAVIGTSPLTLTLVGLLCLGVAALFGTLAGGGRGTSFASR